MKEPLETIVKTEKTFNFGREEVGSINRLWGLYVRYFSEEHAKKDGTFNIEETVVAYGSVGDKENPYGISSAQLNLCFRVGGRDYDFIEDLSARRYFQDEESIRQQAIALLRKELPEYATRILPKT